MKIIEGDLIKLTQEGQFDLIGHGCNCFCKMKRGIAPLIHQAFQVNEKEYFELENPYYEGDMKKLGNIEVHPRQRKVGGVDSVWVANLYTQYHWNEPGPDGHPFNYAAFDLICQKLNHRFKGKKIGLPGLIGAGLAGGDKEKILYSIDKFLKDCDVTIVYIDPTKIPHTIFNLNK